ncbi:MAG: hypothetical protein NZ898_07810 [Myxococcota bacterium]|nr:hypothetical protein [Myxococcota bacterium]
MPSSAEPAEQAAAARGEAADPETGSAELREKAIAESGTDAARSAEIVSIQLRDGPGSENGEELPVEPVVPSNTDSAASGDEPTSADNHVSDAGDVGIRPPADSGTNDESASISVPAPRAHGVDAHRRKVPPEKRGGRPRSEPDAALTSDGGDLGKRQASPRFVARLEVLWISGQWVLVVVLEGTEAYGEEVQPRVFQDDEPLTPDGDAPWTYPVRSFDLPIRLEEDLTGTRRELGLLGPTSILAFRLLAEGNRGTALKRRPRPGERWLLVVPCSMRPDISSGAIRNDEWDPTADPQWIAYHVTIADPSAPIRFTDETGTAYPVDLEGPSLLLDGERLDDAHPSGEPLFIGPTLPVVRFTGDNASSSRRVVMLVVGEEGPGRGRRKVKVDVQSSPSGLKLPSFVRKREAGRYFVRAYDERWNLVDSTSFRYAPGLYAIRFEPDSVPVIPGPDGHQEVCIVVEHGPQLRCVECPEGVSAEPDEKGTRLRVRPHWHCDVFVVAFAPTNPDRATHVGLPERVQVCFALPRLWWRLVRDHRGAENAWTSKPLELRPDDFRAERDVFLEIRVPRGWRRSGIAVRLDQDTTRWFKVPFEDGTVRIPLGDFDRSRLPDGSGARVGLLVQLRPDEGGPGTEVEGAVAHVDVSCLASEACSVAPERPSELVDDLATQARAGDPGEPNLHGAPRDPTTVLASDPDSDSGSGSDSVSDSGPISDSVSDSVSGSVSDSDSDSVSDSDSDSGPTSASGSDSDLGSEPDSESDSDSGSKCVSRLDPWDDDAWEEPDEPMAESEPSHAPDGRDEARDDVADVRDGASVPSTSRAPSPPRRAELVRLLTRLARQGGPVVRRFLQPVRKLLYARRRKAADEAIDVALIALSCLMEWASRRGTPIALTAVWRARASSAVQRRPHVVDPLRARLQTLCAAHEKTP